MSQELALPSVPNLTMIALTPQDMGPVQSDLMGWCQAKIVELSLELKEARQNFRQAKAMKWKSQSWQRVATTLIRRMLYYTKIKAAVRAGYLIVPNFPVEVLAVRVDRSTPKPMAGAYPTSVNEAKADLGLPPGVGHYVDEMIPTYDCSYLETIDGKQTRISQVARRSGYGTPDFPAMLVKPVVLEATERAMSLMIFDRIGLVQQGYRGMSAARKRSDPIVVGQILDGGSRYPEDHRVTFFIAWWLDTRMI